MGKIKLLDLLKDSVVEFIQFKRLSREIVPNYKNGFNLLPLPQNLIPIKMQLHCFCLHTYSVSSMNTCIMSSYSSYSQCLTESLEYSGCLIHIG